MLTLDWPWLLLLLPLPWLVTRFMPPVARQEAALRVPFYSWAGGSATQGGGHRRRGYAGRITLWLLWLAVLVSAARPLWVGPPQPQTLSGRDLLLAVDISGSMGTQDMLLEDAAVDRLTVVKQVLADFIARRPGDRLGLILFGSQAYMQVPLTFDHNALSQLLQEAQIGFAGKNTAIGDAIGLSIKKLQDRPQSSRVLILLTDGANTGGSVEPLDAATMAAQEAIRTYTLGVGADEMLVGGLFGARRVNPSADLDEETLKSIANTTGGRYFRARNTQELEQIYQILDQLEPAQQEAELIRPRASLFHWPLGFALLLSLAWTLTHAARVLLQQRRDSAPSVQGGAERMP